MLEPAESVPTVGSGRIPLVAPDGVPVALDTPSLPDPPESLTAGLPGAAVALPVLPVAAAGAPP
jgi:hypothetical protein